MNGNLHDEFLTTQFLYYDFATFYWILHVISNQIIRNIHGVKGL